MTIHKHAVGENVYIRSFNSTHPCQRANASPPALIIICHGLYQENVTGTISTPKNLPEIRFAVEHGQANENIDYQWFQGIITEGLASALEWDFKYPAGTTIVNYHIGKGEPKYTKGKTPDKWLSYKKTDKLPHPNTYVAKNVMSVNVISSSYVENIMLFAKQKKKEDAFDFATIRKTCHTLDDLFKSLGAAQATPRYNYLLCAFCREPA